MIDDASRGVKATLVPVPLAGTLPVPVQPRQAIRRFGSVESGMNAGAEHVKMKFDKMLCVPGDGFVSPRSDTMESGMGSYRMILQPDGTSGVLEYDLGKYNVSNAEQPSNAYPPMLVTLSGIVIDVSPEQPSNAKLPMLVTPFPIVIDVSPEQP